MPHTCVSVCVCVDEMKDTTIYEYPNSVYSQNVYLPNKVKAKQDAGDVPGTQRKRGNWDEGRRGRYIVLPATTRQRTSMTSDV